MSMPRGPSVLFVDQAGELGGAELSLFDIVRLRTAPSRVLLFTDGPFRERLQAANLSVTVISGASKVLNVGRGSALAAAMTAGPAFAALVLRVTGEARSADLLYANTQKAFVASAMASALSGKPLIWHLRDILTAEHFSRTLRTLAVRLANAKAACIIANSNATAEAFREAGGTCPVRVIHNGIDSAPFDAIDQASARAALLNRLGIPPSQIVGVFSRLAHWKGQHVLIEALRQVPNLHVVFVGGALFGEAEYEAGLRRQTEAAGLTERVHFLGFCSDVPALMKAVDVVAHTSVAPEPFGRVVVEGMLAGRPVIATRAGGVPEIIDDEVTGLLVEPGDVSALATALRRLQASPDLAAALASRGRAAAISRFSLGTCTGAVEALIGEIQTRGATVFRAEGKDDARREKTGA